MDGTAPWYYSFVYQGEEVTFGDEEEEEEEAGGIPGNGVEGGKGKVNAGCCGGVNPRIGGRGISGAGGG